MKVHLQPSRPMRVLFLALACSAALAAQAQAPVGAHVNIPAGDLAASLDAYARQSGTQLLYRADQMQGVRSSGVSGDLPPAQALDRLLQDTGFSARRDASGAMVIVAQAPPAPAIPGPAQTSAGPAPATELESVQVTGTRLDRTVFESPVPMMVASGEQLADEGHRDLAEAISELPGVNLGDSLMGNQTSIQNSGTSTVNLRRLGQNRTLTLIDGRRTVSNAGNRNVVNMATIPAFFVRSVEVTTGGASAVYGSDAIAGVVNIITRNSFDGLRLRGLGSWNNDGGGGRNEFSFLAGKSLLDDRLDLLLTGTYEEQRILQAADRDWALESISYSQADNTVSTPDRSSYTEGGRYGGSDYYYYFDQDNALQRGFETDLHGDDLRRYGTLITPRESLNTAAKATYHLNDTLKLRGQIMHSSIETNVKRNPLGFGHGDTFGVDNEFTVGRVNRDNPYLLAWPEIRASLTSDSDLQWRRRFNELGVREMYNKRDTLRTLINLEGVAFEHWDWQVGYGYGEFEQRQVRRNGINLQNLSHAINAVSEDGQIVCADPQARAAGCVPVDLFGRGAITGEMADYLRSDAWLDTINRQDTLFANMVGSPFELPAGPVQIAYGLESRRDRSSVNADPQTELGISSWAAVPRFSGEITVKEAYLESVLPLLRDRPGAHRLSVDAALRLGNYDLSNVGTTLSWRTGLQWSPIPELNFRTTYSRAQRAPDISEVFSPPRDDYETVADLCDGVTATSTGLISDNCRDDPGVAAAIAESGVFEQGRSSVNTPNAGNRDLQEETADTVTAGLVFSPTSLPGFQASIDYYDIKISKVIRSFTTPMILNSCYANAAGIQDNIFCDYIHRSEEGELITVLNELQNLDRMRARGFDFALAHDFKLDQMDIPGEFKFQLNYGRRMTLENEYIGPDGPEVEQLLGEVNGAKHEGRAALRWEHDGLSLRWTTRYIGPVVDSNARAAYIAQAGIEDPLYFNIGSHVRNDIGFRYSPKQQRNLRFFGTVRNVFDKMGPFMPAGTDSAASEFNFIPSYGPIGRSFEVGIEIDLL